jgi:TrpR-related protein YerC/YecD
MNYNSKLESESIDKLFDAILKLEDREQCYRFFEDLCSISELQAMAQRLEVAYMLAENITYADIAQKTGASTATISRINRCLKYGAGGYSLIVESKNDSDL